MRNIRICLLLCALTHFSSTVEAAYLQADATKHEKQTRYYAIEIEGVLCGYVESIITPTIIDGRNIIHLRGYGFAILSALGNRFNTELVSTYRIDPETGQFNYYKGDIKQGDVTFSTTINVDNNIARCITNTSKKETAIDLSRYVILENTLYFPYLIEDFTNADIEAKSYDIFDVKDMEIQESTYYRRGTEFLELSDSTYSAIIFEEINHATGLKVTLWIDTQSGYFLKAIYSNGRTIYLANSSVKKRIKMVNLDNSLITRTNVLIIDSRQISYMKVKATIEPVGSKVTAEDLNTRGQSFVGNAKENRIEGTFEMQYRHYDGTDAPSFPLDYSGNESLNEYLDVSALNEPSDSTIINEAWEITNGAIDSWDAACRISRWVADNIDYAIPGGITARNTFNSRSGECGAQSLLLACLCRVTGIPARTVWGCMYIPQYGGSFAQHAWNEIYMGKAGWIAIDATSSETAFVDSGHIRIGTMPSTAISLNAEQMIILDYKVKPSDVVDEREYSPDDH